MKNTLRIFILALLLSCSSEDELPSLPVRLTEFALEGKEYYFGNASNIIETRSNSLDGKFEEISYSQKIWFSGDTLVDGNYYKFVWLEDGDSSRIGLIRDIQVGRVFYRTVLDSLEELLYDFTLTVGDTIGSDYVMQSVDTVLSANRRYPLLQLSNCCRNLGWIPSIGDTSFFYSEMLDGSCVLDTSTTNKPVLNRLIAVKFDDEVIFKSGSLFHPLDSVLLIP